MIDAEVQAELDSIKARVSTLEAAVLPPPPPPPPPVSPPPPVPPPDHPHPDDESKQAEHMAMLAIVPAAAATLFVPPGETVTLTGENEHVGIRVEGTLLVSGTLKVETLIGVPGSRVELTDSHVIIRDFGELTDPLRLGRGIICHGSARLSGAVLIESENAAPNRRGHVMFMHSPQVEIDGQITLRNLGRTDKSRPVTDPPNLDNVRGRYPLHFHRTGLAKPVRVRGVTVEGSLGWGIVNHESWVEADDCTCIDTFGAGFVTETGAERGHFRNCHAYDIPGNAGETTTDGTRGGRTTGDFGVAGHGFWIHGGGNVLIEGGSVTRTAGDGIVHMNVEAKYLKLADLDPEFAGLRAAGSIWPHPEGLIPSGDVPIRVRGVTVSESGNGTSHLPWSVHNPAWHEHERSDITDVVYDGAIVSGYSNRTDYRRVKARHFGHTGVVFEHLYEDCEVVGSPIGVQMPTDGVSRVVRGRFANLIDFFITNKVNPARGTGRELIFDGVTFGEADPSIQWPDFNGPLPNPGRYHFYLAPVFVWFDIRNPVGDWWPNLFLAATTFQPDVIRVDGEYLSFEEWGRDFLLPAGIPDRLRLKADGAVKTNGEFYDETGSGLWGRVPIIGERRPFVRGLFHSDPVVLLDPQRVPE